MKIEKLSANKFNVEVDDLELTLLGRILAGVSDFSDLMTENHQVKLNELIGAAMKNSPEDSLSYYKTANYYNELLLFVSLNGKIASDFNDNIHPLIMS